MNAPTHDEMTRHCDDCRKGCHAPPMAHDETRCPCCHERLTDADRRS